MHNVYINVELGAIEAGYKANAADQSTCAPTAVCIVTELSVLQLKLSIVRIR
jgi:hypothetical protein